MRDSAGQTRTTQRDIKPRTVQVTLASSPSGLSLTLDGQPKVAPHTFLAVVGMQRTLGAPTPQTLAPKTYRLPAVVRWRHADAHDHHARKRDDDHRDLRQAQGQRLRRTDLSMGARLQVQREANASERPGGGARSCPRPSMTYHGRMATAKASST